MGDAAKDIGAAVLRAIREAPPTNTVLAPRWVRLDAEAARRGFASTRALRAWCHAHGVEVREASNRDAWVSPEAIDRAVEGLPPARRPVGPVTEHDAELRQRGILP